MAFLPEAIAVLRYTSDSTTSSGLTRNEFKRSFGVYILRLLVWLTNTPDKRRGLLVVVTATSVNRGTCPRVEYEYQ